MSTPKDPVKYVQSVYGYLLLSVELSEKSPIGLDPQIEFEITNPELVDFARFPDRGSWAALYFIVIMKMLILKNHNC